jgi:hypothetical protein
VIADHWLSILSICVSVGLPIVIFAARNWLVAWISKGVQHHFDVRLEELRAEFRRNEELLKSDLRDRETEIATLRNNVLSGAASRQALLEKRRFEAVEKVWTAVNDLGQLKGLASMMARLNFKAMANEADDPRMQQVLSMLAGFAPDIQKLRNVARDERPFLPEIAWAYFASYTTILYGTQARFMMLKTGVRGLDKYLTKEAAQNILKAALPHQSKFIEENEPETYYFLLEEIEANLLVELRRILEGKQADQAATAHAKEILEAVRHANEERTKEALQPRTSLPVQ